MLPDASADDFISGGRGFTAENNREEMNALMNKTRFYRLAADTPCEPLKITARLTGRGASAAPVVKIIRFAGGE